MHHGKKLTITDLYYICMITMYLCTFSRFNSQLAHGDHDLHRHNPSWTPTDCDRLSWKAPSSRFRTLNACTQINDDLIIRALLERYDTWLHIYKVPIILIRIYRFSRIYRLGLGTWYYKRLDIAFQLCIHWQVLQCDSRRLQLIFGQTCQHGQLLEGMIWVFGAL